MNNNGEKSIYTEGLRGSRGGGGIWGQVRVGEVGMTLLFNWLVVDKTHCIIIFNHSLDELSFGQSLCEAGK